MEKGNYLKIFYIIYTRVIFKQNASPYCVQTFFLYIVVSNFFFFLISNFFVFNRFKKLDFGKPTHMMMSLPFLPEGEINPVFQRLRRQATTAQLREIVDYISRTWINNPLWLVSSWSAFNKPVRTNNDLQGWHKRLNKSATGRCNLQFYPLIRLLHKEAKLTSLYTRLVSEKELQRIQRKKYRNRQYQIFGLWDDYMRGSATFFQLVEACSRLSDPVRS